jgi:hypothetical protein
VPILRVEPRHSLRPKDIAVLDHNVAHVDANAVFDATLWRYDSIALGHLALDLDGTAQRISHTAELGEKAVARRLDEPAVMRSDLRIY